MYILWGSTFIAIRVAVETIPPLLLGGVRYVAAGAVLLAVGKLGRPQAERLDRRHWQAAAVVGLLMLGGGTGLLAVGEKEVAAGVAALLVGAVPIWLVVADAVMQRRRPRLAVAFGLLVGLLGIAVLAWPAKGATRSLYALGILAGTVAWAAGSLYARAAALPRTPLLAAALEMICGGLALTALAAAVGEGGSLNVSSISGRSAVAFAWLVGAGSLVAFSAYMYALRTLPTTTVATYAFVNPIVAVVIGWLLIDEHLGWREAAAGAMVIAAVALLIDPRPRRAPPAAP